LTEDRIFLSSFGWPCRIFLTVRYISIMGIVASAARGGRISHEIEGGGFVLNKA